MKSRLPHVPEPVWFTRREREIMNLLGQARETKTIAGQLNISAGAVYFHKASVRRKLDLASDRELMLWIYQHPEDVRIGHTRESGLGDRAA